MPCLPPSTKEACGRIRRNRRFSRIHPIIDRTAVHRSFHTAFVNCGQMLVPGQGRGVESSRPTTQVPEAGSGHKCEFARIKRTSALGGTVWLSERLGCAQEPTSDCCQETDIRGLGDRPPGKRTSVNTRPGWGHGDMGCNHIISITVAPDDYCDCAKPISHFRNVSRCK